MRSGSSTIDRAPPGTVVRGDGGGGGGWAWLLTARGVVEAQLVRGVLECNGIEPVALDARDPSPGAWLFLSGDPNALVRIYVPRTMLQDARLTLLETGLNEPTPARPVDARRRWADRWWWVCVTILVLGLYLIATFRNSGL